MPERNTPDMLGIELQVATIWSPEHKIVLERQLWIAVLKAQRDLGIDDRVFAAAIVILVVGHEDAHRRPC